MPNKPDALNTSAASIRQIYETAYKELLEKTPATDRASIEELDKGMDQALLLVELTEHHDNVFSAEEMEQTCVYLFNLLHHLLHKSHDQLATQSISGFEQLYIPFSLWLAEQQATLFELEPVANAFAKYANQQHGADALAQISSALGKILSVVSPQIKEDLLDFDNPGRPWRVLNFNRAIVATRSHDQEVIQQAYADLLENLPDEARQFFSEGMKQMDSVDYPQHVRDIMQQYNDRWGDEDAIH
jgi:hypothetical protein